MKVTILAENNTISDLYASEHGLSLYIETQKQKILFDMGRGTLFAENAEKMGIDLSKVDIAFLSHGHYDHGGGLKTFLAMNDKAKVYIQKEVFGQYFSDRENGEKAYIGIQQDLASSNRLIYASSDQIISENLRLFAKPAGDRHILSANASLFEKKLGAYVPDEFDHEQSLLITEDETSLLIVGCAHSGITNILENVHEKIHAYPDYVLGGFHLFNPANKRPERQELIQEIGQFLNHTGSTYYTCHCTGLEPYQDLKKILFDKVTYAATGCVLQLEKEIGNERNM